MSKKNLADSLSIGLWVANIAHRTESVEAWCEMVGKVLETARKKRFNAIMLPEYISEQWMHFAPHDLKGTEELAWLAKQSSRALPLLQKAVKETGVALLAGTAPWKDGKNGPKERIVNRAWMLFPDRKPVFHDKLVLIPSEKDPNFWMLSTGKTIRTFKWRGFTLSMLICLDVEMPAISHLIAEKDIDLLLVPSMTEKASGYYRVFHCARARAVELMTAVLAVGCVDGAFKGGKGKLRTACSGGASVFIPCEQQFGYTGLFAETPVHAKSAGIGKILWAKNIPVGKIRALRRSKPEVWPGPWDAHHVNVKRA